MVCKSKSIGDCKMTNKRKLPIRSKQHEINDIGTAIFHYAISKHMVSRSIEKNDYGIDELIDIVDISDVKSEHVQKLPGQILAVQLKSSTRKSKSLILKKSTLNYLFDNNIPAFLVKVDINSKTYSFANIRKQVRKNWESFKSNNPFSLKLTKRTNDEDREHVLKELERRYLNHLGTSSDDLELDYLLCNVSLLMEFSEELDRDDFELDVMLFLSTFETHLSFLNDSLMGSNDLGVIYGKINSNAEFILTMLKEDSGNFYRCQPKKDNSDLRIGLIYQELANMYLALEGLIKMFTTEKDYWYFKYGCRMDNIWPNNLMKYFNELYGSITGILESGNLVKLAVLLNKIKR